MIVGEKKKDEEKTWSVSMWRHGDWEEGHVKMEEEIGVRHL